MKKILFLFLFIVLLQGCASSYNTGNFISKAIKYGCKNVSGGYNCPKSVPDDFLSNNDCTKVGSYYRNDGVFVSGYIRCKMPEYISTNSVNSNCHYVKGYYRKNGTYVRGYQRCR